MNLLTILGLCSMAFVAWFTWRAYSGHQFGSGQTRRESIVEAWVNLVLGFTINFIANLWIIPLMMDGQHLSHSANFWGGWIYTTISIVRQYSIRRFFNTSIHVFSAWLATRFCPQSP